MNFVEWSKSNVDYGCKLVDSALEGARTGEDEFLSEQPLGLYLEESAKQAACPAVIGACVGLLGGLLGRERRSAAKAVAYAVIGGVIGFGAGVIWENRGLTARVASGAWKSLNKARDEHWFEKHPIDYA